MKKIIIVLLILSLIFIPNVIASTPSFSVTELLEDSLNNGESNFGDILFVENTYITDYHPMSIIQSGAFQKYDTLNWLGLNSVKIVAPNLQETILVNGSQYYFTQTGIHHITSLVNSSETNLITISQEDDNIVNINNIVVPNGFEVLFSTTSFILNNERNVPVDIIVDDDVENGDYSLSYDVNNITYTKDVEILENINWTMDDDNFTNNPTIKAGEGQYLGRVIIENIGNQNIEIVVSKSGNNTGMIGIPQPQTLYRKNIMNLDFQAQVSTITSAGEYDITLLIVGGNISKEIEMTVTIIDAINPIIESINFSSDKVFVENEIRVIATDNDDVVKLTLEYDNKDIEFEKDGNLFTKTIEFTKLSKYILNFCAEDEEGNVVCEEINKTFIKVDVIEGNQNVLNMDSMRYGKYSRIYLFNITENTNEDVIVNLFSYDTIPNLKNNTIPVFRIVNQDGSIKNFGKYDNEVRLNSIGEYFFEVRADIEVDITGILRIEMEEQYKEIEDITFNVDFKTYDVPNDFSVPWINGRDMICKVEDTGNLDTSYYDCSLTFPIDTRAEDISIPTTVGEKNQIEGIADKVRDELSKSKSNSGWVIGITIALLLIVILWGLYYIFWFRYIRFKTGKEDKK